MKTLYFLNRGEILSEAQFVPIKAKQSQWVVEKSPNRLTRRYNFEDYNQLVFFVSSLLSYANKLNHYPDLEVGYDTVLVTTYTHSLQDITEQDVRIKKMSDQIYSDAVYSATDFQDTDNAEQEENVNNDERLTEGYRFDWTTDW
jgi:4a-hydroxytetrahydrobiopterin dehydratase